MNATTAPAYELRRTIRGELQARTVEPLGFDSRELHITTDKGARGLSCDAAVYRRTADGLGLEHAFGVAGGGDFRVTLAADRTARATEKAIRTMHAAALQQLPEVLAKARAHYGKA